MMRRIGLGLLWAWQLPQHLVALILMRMSGNAKRTEEHGIVYYVTPRMGRAAVSLGEYIIVGVEGAKRRDVIQHEAGHSRQSRMLGPLYLLVVGLPSVAMNLLSRASYAFGRGIYADAYHERWPESWADRLGGVKRG